MDINTPKCVHYWICEPVNGAVRGTCRYCGEIRMWEKKSPQYSYDILHEDTYLHGERQDKTEDEMMLL
jgi:hypothetical protein